MTASLRSFALAFIAAVSVCFIATVALLWRPGQDSFGAISRPNDPSWFMNYRFSFDPNRVEAQDRDILFYGIGRSIGNSKHADIIILGDSMVMFGLYWKILDEFSSDHSISTFNLGSGGDVSGEFLLRVVEKFHIQPKLWIVNVDDYGGFNYFKSFIDETSKGEAGDVIRSGWLTAYTRSILRNLRWRLSAMREDFMAAFPPIFQAQTSIVNYRSDKNGAWLNDLWPKYWDRSNPAFVVSGGPDCVGDPIEARAYIKRLHAVAPDSSVVLTLVPHKLECRAMVADLAIALGLPFINVAPANFTSFDGGGHLDGGGARRFTTEFLAQLTKLEVFHSLTADRRQ